jgi:hypothetical protein
VAKNERTRFFYLPDAQSMKTTDHTESTDGPISVLLSLSFFSCREDFYAASVDFAVLV